MTPPLRRRSGRRYVLLVAAALLFAAGCGGGDRRGVTSPGDRVLRVAASPRIAYIGDSISANYYAGVAAHGFREVLTSLLHGRQVYAVTRPGRTIAQLLVATEASPPSGADLVVVEAGTNDPSRSIPAEVSQQAYRVLLRVIHRASPHAAVLCAGLWHPVAEAAQYDRRLAPVCRHAGGVYVQVSRIYARAATRGPSGSASYLGPRDDFHPNDVGHWAIATALRRAVRA